MSLTELESLLVLLARADEYVKICISSGWQVSSKIWQLDRWSLMAVSSKFLVEGNVFQLNGESYCHV